MKKLFEIVNEKHTLKLQLSTQEKTFSNFKHEMQAKICELERLEKLASENNDLEKIQLAETVLYVHGNPYGRTSDVNQFNHATIAEQAIIDIASGCQHLKRQFFGNKRYEGYYQGTDCEYGMGPKHGSIVDEIGLKQSARTKDLTDEEKDACIYYLRNYQKIKAAIEVK